MKLNIASIKDQFSRIGLLANQTSYYPSQNAYLATILGPSLKRVFVPEHGFFAELQDQETLDETSLYHHLNPHADFVSVYASNKQQSLRFRASHLSDLDCLIVDIQDIGVRYFTYITTLYYLFEALKKNQVSFPVFIINRPNPNMQRVEGTPMQSAYQSFIGVAGLPHCYGLSIWQLAQWLQATIQNTNSIQPVDHTENNWIAPSPNMPTVATTRIYPGICLLEATTLSEGRGTTMPFHLFGSPHLKFHQLQAIITKMQEITAAISPLDHTWHLRPLQFIPVFHKHAGKLCNGFELSVTAPQFHSLLFALLLLKETSRCFDASQFWRPGPYEFGNNKTAIELLAGDAFLLEFLMKDMPVMELWGYVKEAEMVWKRECGWISS